MIDVDMDQCLAELSEAVWSQTLGLSLEPVGAPPTNTGRTLEGHVHISGKWQGTIVVQCSLAAARDAAQIMFSSQEPAESSQDVQDAVGELVNMIGGNIKSLMSEDGCYLSLPIVIEGGDYTVRMAGARVISRRAFVSGQEPVVVTLLTPVSTH